MFLLPLWYSLFIASYPIICLTYFFFYYPILYSSLYLCIISWIYSELVSRYPKKYKCTVCGRHTKAFTQRSISVSRAADGCGVWAALCKKKGQCTVCGMHTIRFWYPGLHALYAACPAVSIMSPDVALPKGRMVLSVDWGDRNAEMAFWRLFS